jgi:hypothetical protein
MTLPHAIAAILATFGGILLMAAYVSWGVLRDRLAGVLLWAAAVLFAAATIVHFLALVR